MAAGSCHHRVDLSMKRMGNKLYDFSDIVEVVKKAALHTEMLQMNIHFSCGQTTRQHKSYLALNLGLTSRIWLKL